MALVFLTGCAFAVDTAGLAETGPVVTTDQTTVDGGGSSGSTGTGSDGSIVTVPDGAAANASIGGNLTGLSGTLVLRNGAATVTLSQNGAWSFPDSVPVGSTYAVTVDTLPAGQACSVANGSGVVGSGGVQNVAVACADTQSLGGTISGLTGSGLVLNDGVEDLPVSAGATTFTFPTRFAVGAAYSVTVKTQPSAQSCQITGGSGTMSASGVTTVAVACATLTYPLSVNVTNLKSGAIFQNNGGDNLSPSTSGTYAFPTHLAAGVAYAVTIAQQPARARCTLASPASGTMPAGPVTVNATCVDSFVENFDEASGPIPPAGWSVSTAQGSAVDAWTFFSGGADTPPNFMGQTARAYLVDTRLTSPVVAIGSTNARLMFRSAINAELGFDGGVLEVSVNGGAFQDVLAAGFTFVKGGYTGVIATAYSSAIAGRQAWTGSSTGWYDTWVDLTPAVAGQSLQFRWRWASDNSQASPVGWAIDTIQLDP